MGALDIIKPILKFIPEIRAPSVPPSFPQKVTWTILALVLFFVMYNVVAVGVDPKTAAQSDFLQVVTASRVGSLITIGIGPIVLASIFLQLFAGAKIINIDMKDPDQRAAFFGIQKLLAVTLCFLEAYFFVFLGHAVLVQPLFHSIEGQVVQVIDPGHAMVQTGSGLIQVAMNNAVKGQIYAPITEFIVMLQIALGSIVLLFLDEVVSKHGIGSGISLFIAGGVSLSIVGGAISIFVGDNGVFATLAGGGAEVIANAIIVMLPIFFTILVFLVVIYAEGMKIEIPLAFERARGINTGLPIKLTYVSNMPVILAFALIANFQFMAIGLVGAHFCVGAAQANPVTDVMNACPGGIDLVNIIGRSTGGNGAPAQFVDGLLYFISPIYRPLGNNYSAYFSYMFTHVSPVFGLPEIAHVIIYILFLMVACVIFGQFWVETTGMGPKDVANQLDSAGLQIPGYRRDPRIVASMLEKYIPPVVVLGSAFVGLLAGLADLTGALGTGTGILLTVGILYKMYQDIEKQNVLESSSIASKLLG